MNAYLYATKVNECESRKKGGRWQISQSSGHNAWHTIHIEFAVCLFNCVWTDSSNYLRDAIYLVKSNQLELVEVTFSDDQMNWIWIFRKDATSNGIFVWILIGCGGWRMRKNCNEIHWYIITIYHYCRLSIIRIIIIINKLHWVKSYECIVYCIWIFGVNLH